MADEAFALSPISARAVEPGEADYEAISAAFMETSRGRWFLSEYAKRNRNADTRMVLDAVARIEENLAAQKDAAIEDRLPAALAAIRQAVNEARHTAADAGAGAEAALAPVRAAAQTIRDILARLREIGADGRIYDLMDAQVTVIEAGCARPGLTHAETALGAAFDLIEQRIAEFEGKDGAPRPAPEAPPEPASDAPREEIAAAVHFETAAASDTAREDAVLDIIALEMSADVAEAEAAAFDVPDSDPVMPLDAPGCDAPFAVQPPEPLSSVEPSLGASLIANGVVRRPESAADPLAAIRRMSQAEKIAFFS